MANKKQLAILEQGVEVWNKWRKDNPDVEIDLSQEDFTGRAFLEANFSRANLWDSNLTDTWLIRANLSHANLRNANLFRSKVFGVGKMTIKCFLVMIYTRAYSEA